MHITVYCDDESHAPKVARVGNLEQLDLALADYRHDLDTYFAGVPPKLVWAPERSEPQSGAVGLLKIDFKCPLCGLHLRARSERLTPIIDQLVASSALPESRVSLKFLALCYTR